MSGTYYVDVEGLDWGNDIDASFVITVPSTYNVRVSTAGGDIRIGDIGGNVYARTSGGDLTVGRVTGEVDGRTSGGDSKMNWAPRTQAATRR